jgi:hypothetical protein
MLITALFYFKFKQLNNKSMKKLLLLLLLCVTQVKAQHITVWYPSCDTVRLTSDTAQYYQWDTYATTRSITMKYTDTTQYMGVLTNNGYVQIKQPKLPAIDYISSQLYYMNSTTAVIYDLNYTGDCNIFYSKWSYQNVLNVGFQHALQWQIFQVGTKVDYTYYIRETKDKCVRKSGPIKMTF